MSNRARSRPKKLTKEVDRLIRQCQNNPHKFEAMVEKANELTVWNGCPTCHVSIEFVETLARPGLVPQITHQDHCPNLTTIKDLLKNSDISERLLNE
jgi:hypothetical protein